MSAIFDTHCHYNLEPLLSTHAEHWAKAQAAGVSHSMIVGTDLTSCDQAATLAATEPNWYAAIGIHPNEYDIVTNEEEGEALLDHHHSELRHLLARPKVTAIGETGLDYFRPNPDASKAALHQATQRAAFTLHIDLANELKLPLIIHVRDREQLAYQHVLELLRQHHSAQRPFILHCISGSLTYVKAALELGAYIGVAGNVTYKNAELIRDLVRSVPRDRILTETDAPYLPPQTFRGQTCEPWMISHTTEFLVTELGLQPEQLFANALDVFNLS